MTSTAIRNPSGRIRPARRSLSLIAPGVAAALTLAACGSSDSVGDAAGDGADITVSDVWARTSPMATESGVVYFDITSVSGDALIGGSVDPSIAAEVQVHETTMVDPSALDGDAMEDGAAEVEPMEDEPMQDDDAAEMDDHSDMGVMQMREVGTVELPAGVTVAFESGGYHVMLVDLASPLETDQTFDLTLDFATAPDLVVSVTVSDDAPSS